MIFIDRYRRDENGVVIAPTQAWFDTAADLTDDAEREGAQHVVSDHYKHAEIKKALEYLFHDKCAYCESRIGTGGSWDVEHYRPKGAVSERADHPGYYWLAYDWENLYPSCSSCNRRLTDPPRFRDNRTLPAEGKSTQFPLADETSRAMSPDDDYSEELPYLLDPNVDNPELHLTYDIQGQIDAIDSTDPFATETIKLCHLRRRRLRDDRARIIAQVRGLQQNVELAKAAGNTLAVALLEEILSTFLDDSALYAGAARAVVRDPEAFETQAEP